MKNIKKLPKYLGSSVDPEKLSLTIKGLLIGAVPLIVYIASLFKVDLTPTELTDIVNQAFMVVSGVVTLIGAVRKVYVKSK